MFAMPKPLSEQLYVGDFLYEWQVDEYEQHDRSRRWYLVVGILAVLLILYGVFTSNFLFTLIILLAGIIVYLQSQQAPMSVPVAITEKGVIVGRRFYSYDEFLQFYIIFIPGQVKTLYFDSRSAFQPRLQLPIDDLDPTEVRETLSQFLDEDFEKEDEPFSEQVRKIWQIH